MSKKIKELNDSFSYITAEIGVMKRDIDRNRKNFYEFKKELSDRSEKNIQNIVKFVFILILLSLSFYLGGELT